MKRLQMPFIYAATAFVLVVSPFVATTALTESWAAPDQGLAARSEPYRQAQQAMDAENWEQAESLFLQVVEEGGDDAEAALYWQAYAQLQRGRAASALQTLARLERSYPDSSWIDDARALEVEARQASGRRLVTPEGDDEELKLYALSNLMLVKSERALPVLEEFLAGDHSAKLEERALFVISQSDSPRAQEILLRIAKGEEHPELALQAIEYLGLQGTGATGHQLQEIYGAAQTAEVKAKTLEAMMLGGHQEMVLAAAREEKDPELRGQAVEQLGVMGATDALRELYRAESEREVKVRILEGLFIASDEEILAEVAQSEQDPALRSKAIEGLGLVNSQAARETLASVYRVETDRAIKQRILESFMLQSNHQALIEVIRSEEDPELRKSALQYLTLIDSDEAVEFLLQAIED
jgi:HEAT repeat protein